MGSKTLTKTEMLAAREGGVITYKGNSVLGAVIAKGVAKAAPHTVPWMLGAGLLGPATATHHLWGTAEALPWATAGLALSGAGLTAVTWAVSRWRHTLGRLQSTGTTAAASGWLLAATITGPTARPTIDLWIWVGGTLAAAWNIRNVIREKADPGGEMVAPGGAGAFFKSIFSRQDHVEVETVRNVAVEPTRVAGTVQLDGGDTADDLQRALPRIEAEHGLPVGSLSAAVNPEDAGAPTVVMSNPLVLKDPIPWPGPSAVGESVARPHRVAKFQDGSLFGLEVVGSHIQIMGMTGAAKTTAGAWGLWGEFITRKDGALIVVDITKKEQTVGPARAALHGAVTEEMTAKRFFKEWLPAWATKRLQQFGERGLIAWQEGCGFSYLLVHIEEAADVFDHIDMAAFVNLAQMLRSAGGSFVWSLQRADSTQMPTIVKGQGGSKICFGVESSHDAGWGLSEAQEKTNADPAQWGATRPGMAYADAGGARPDRIAMPMRWFDWGTTNNERVANFRAHCERFPASARPVDKATAWLLDQIGGTSAAAPAPSSSADDDPEVSNVTRDYLKADAELDQYDAANPVDPDAELADVPDIPLGKPAAEKLSRDDALRVLERTLDGFADGRPFTPKDLYGVLEVTGFTRGWLQNHLAARVKSGELERDEDAGTYRRRVLAGV